MRPDLGAAWVQKLCYTDTDTDVLLVRWANAVNKCRAFLASWTRIEPNSYANIIDVIDIQYALHAWLRQLQYFQLLQNILRLVQDMVEVGVFLLPSHETMRWVVTDPGGPLHKAKVYKIT